MTNDMHYGMADYQETARETAIYPEKHAITYPLLGLVGEVGEFANKYKKVIRDGREFPIDDMVSELGDILWYLSNLAYDCGIALDVIARENVAKLQDRQARNVIGGSGDKR